ncbi:Uncharacterised protein [Mycobacteroides abscessus subsp. abscessus]|nr:Uncharacterised protein [Mycobacteroides abscessus subsp. abscessus]
MEAGDVDTFQRELNTTDHLAEFGALTGRTNEHIEPLPEGGARYSATMRMIPPPPEYAAVYERRGIPVPLLYSDFNPAALWPYEPRHVHRRYAQEHGYFWLPCPLCGRHFGGHEITDSVPTGEAGTSQGICPMCSAERNGGQP